MTRLAILIGDITEYSDLPGVYADLNRMYAYLTSHTGGAFRREEIVVCKNGLWSEVERHIEYSQQFDYCCVYYAGHGGFSARQNRSLVHFKDETIIAHNLMPEAAINLLILDSCQTFIDRYNLTEPLQGIGDIGYASLDLSLYRHAFDLVLQNSNPGTIVIHGAERSLAAYDGHFGGHFTQSLLYCAQHIQEITDEPFLSVEEMVEPTNALLESIGNGQASCIDFFTPECVIPFAIHLEPTPHTWRRSLRYRRHHH